jgi:hypothetical protein
VRCCCCTADEGLPVESELRAELLVLLQGVDLQTVSYKQLHAQLEDKFKVRNFGCDGEIMAVKLRQCV